MNLKIFLSLFLVIIVDTMGMGIIFPVLSPLVLEQSSTLVSTTTSIPTREMLYGGIMGIFSLFLLIGAPLLGDFSDSVGRKRALLICVTGTGLSFFLCAAGIWQSSLILLFLGRALNGFTAGSNSIAQAAIADMSTAANKAKNLGLITLANCVGFVVGPAFGGYFAEHPFIHSVGFSAPFVIAACLAFINILFLILFVRDHKKQVRRPFHFKLSLGVSIFMDAIRRPSVRIAALLFLFLQLGWSIYFQFISIILVQTYHYGATQIGFFLTFIGLLFTICLTFLVRFLFNLTSTAIIMRVSFFILTVALILCPLMKTESHQWFITIPIAFSIGLLYTGGLALFSNAVKKSEQGWVMGVSAAVAAVAWTFGSGLAGFLGRWGLEWPFMFAAFSTLSGFMLSLKIKEKKHHAK